MNSAPKQRRLWLRLLMLFGVFALVFFALLGWYVTTERFQQSVRRRVIASLEKVTGARVELGELHTSPLRLRIDVRNLTLHGREAPGETPYLHIDRLQAELKIISLLSTTIGLHSLVLDHPVVHLVVYPDGSTNVPGPPVHAALSAAKVEQLMALSISHVQVHGGELQWQEHRIPLELDARDFSLELNYSLLHRHYEAQLSVGSVPTRFQQRSPFVWQGDAALVLSRNQAEIHALNLISGKSEIHFNGRVQDFRDPQIAGDYRGTFDLGELAHLAPELGLHQGMAQIEGKGTWNLHDFSFAGMLQGKDLKWTGYNVKMQNGRLSAGYSITPQRLQISALRASLLGGELRGDIDIANWHTTSPPASGAVRLPAAGRGARDNRQRGSVRLQLSAFPLAPGLSLLSSQKLPLDSLHLAGAASGEVNAQWVGSVKDAEATIKLNIVPPAQLAAGEVGLRGAIDGVYRGLPDELEVSQLHLSTPASDITASGNLAATSSLQFAFSSHDLREWKPLLKAAFNSQELPFTVYGFVNFRGSARGRLSDFALNGNLGVYDFETRLPARAQLPARTVHWDALTTDFQYSTNNFSARNAALIHGRTVAHLSLNAGLNQAALQENSPFALHLDLSDLDIAEAARLASFTPQVGGSMNLTANFSGTLGNPQGEGRIQVRNASALGVPAPFLRSDLRLANHQLQFNNISTSIYGAPLTGSAAIGTTLDSFRLNLAGENLDLAQLLNFHTGGIAIDGRADFTLVADGSPQQPALDAHLHLRDLAFDRERAGDFSLDATTHGRLADIQGRSDFPKADLQVRGTIGLDSPFPADLAADFRNLDVDSLLNAYIPGGVTGHAPVAGTVVLRGPLRSPKDLSVAATIPTLNVEIAHVKLQNADPVRFEIAKQVLRLEDFDLTGSGTDFTAHGTADLAQPRALDLRAEGTVNMGLLHALNPKVSARGTLALKLDANGTTADPVLQGRIDVQDTSLSHDDFPSGLSDLNGVLLFDRSRIEIENLKGTAGGGTVTLTGSAAYQKGALLMDLAAKAQDVRLRYPPGVSSTANADLRLTGTSEAPLLSGHVLVTKLSLTPGFDFASYLEKSKQAVGVAKHDSLASRLKLDVHVTSTPELQMRTALAKLSGNADLRVRGTADRPVILGRSVSEGDVSFNGTKYHVDRADITFSNPAKTEPVVDIQASTRVRDYDITVTLNGDVSKPNGLRPSWRSEPPLPEADVITLLALGRTREESAAAAQAAGSSFGGFGGDASNVLINQALNSAMSSRVQRLFGVSRIKIDPEGLAGVTNVVRGPQVTIEQQVVHNLTVTYSTNVSLASQQIIQVEYNLTRNISVVALRDQNGVVSFDIKVRQRKR